MCLTNANCKKTLIDLEGTKGNNTKKNIRKIIYDRKKDNLNC